VIRNALRITIGAVTLLAIGIGMLWLRNHQMDSAARALKEANGEAALRRLTPLAHLGDKSAQALVGYTYAFGWGGVRPDDEKAIYWFRRSGPDGLIRQGGATADDENVDPAASFELSVAKAYANGTDGVTVDSAASARWLRLAARGGSQEASALLNRHP
jgi:uncharacterized protein